MLEHRLGNETSPCSEAVLELRLEPREARLHCAGSEAELMRMPRSALAELLAGQPALLPAWHCDDARYRVELQFSGELDAGGLAYEPIGMREHPGHAELTGGILRALLAAQARHSPRIHAEMHEFIRCVRGFELPPLPGGAIGSFSTPLQPGLIGFNVAYTEKDQPRLDPLCFTWLGHELAHTKNYVIDDVAFHRGAQFLNNAGETRFVPRYARQLSLRTIFQVPYVHLYELALLMDFLAGGFAGVPWEVTDTRERGEEIVAEIAEAVVILEQHAQCSELGQAALDRQRTLFDRACARWRRVRMAA